mmetsp:Transcript_20252/g.40412  ORF Transcript_20252/g.40412 Transcript_20252/m.40412 type:complete len:309 (+) Transcript_20252:513-1439(+)
MELINDPDLLLPVVAGEPPHGHGHGPDIPLDGAGHMGRPVPLNLPRYVVVSLLVGRIVPAEDEPPRVLVHFLVVFIAQVGRREQAGHIGVVHQHAVAQPVHLVGVDPSILVMVYYPVRLYPRVDFVRQPRRPPRQPLALRPERVRHFGGVPQRDDGEHVGGHQIVELAFVVGGAEAGPGHARELSGGALAAAGQARIAVGTLAVLTVKQIARWMNVVLVALLGGPEINKHLHRLAHRGVSQYGSVGEGLVVEVHHAEEVAARVQLVVPRADVVVASHRPLLRVEHVAGVDPERVGVRIVPHVKGAPPD